MSEVPQQISRAELPVASTCKVGRYTLCYRVAQGGMASVYLAQIATKDAFHKWVAVKVIHPQFSEDKRFVQMFLDEARLAAQIHHPNVCNVFDFGEAEGTYYLAMEYLHGESLNAASARASVSGGMPLPLAARIVSDAARGLHAAHELRGPDGRPYEVVHRDVSPQNIFVLYDGVAKVVDFGVARSRDRLAERTEAGELKGKIAYMAPEQLRQQPIDRRADVFALGVVLWEITLGCRLFKRDTEVDTIMAVLRDEIPRPTKIVAGYPSRLEAIVMRALAREPDDRYPTAAEMADELDAFIAGLGEPAGAPQVAQLMQALFADRIAIRTALLRRGLSDKDVPDIEVETPSPAGAPDVSIPRAPTGRTRLERPLRSRARRRTWLLALALGASAGTTVVLARAGRVAPVARTRTAPRSQTLPTQGSASATTTVSPPPLASRGEPSAPPASPLPHTETPVESSPSTARTERALDNRTSETRSHRSAARRGVLDFDPNDTRPGFLSLIAVPSAMVYEGSTQLGYTPMVRHAMTPGRHVLRLVPAGGGPERVMVVHIHPGARVSESVRWR